jgi:hypothetical protein
MKKRIGEWLLDVAKYILTVLFLSSLIKDMDKPVIVWAVTIGFLTTLIVGFYLVSDAKPKKRNNNKRRK